MAVCSASPPAGAQTAGSLKVIQTLDVPSIGFDPAFIDDPGWPTYLALFDTLTREDSHLVPHPRLAVSWSFDRTNTQLTLKLRPGLKFSDGTPLTAADIVWNINRYLDPSTGANIRRLLTLISSATAPDPSTVVLKFAHPNPTIFDALDNLMISGRGTKDQIKSHPIATGPFTLTENVPGDHVTLTANAYYWQNGHPLLRSIVVRPVPDRQAQVVAMQTGAADLLWNPDYTDAATLKKNAALSVRVTSPNSLVVDILFNAKRAPFSDGRLRRAVGYALDRAAFVKVATAGQSRPWCIPWEASSPAYDPAYASCPQDLAKAKKLLAEAGFPNGFSTTIGTYQESWSTALAQTLSSDLAKIGVHANIQQMQDAVADATLKQGKFEMWSHDFGRANRHPYTLLAATFAWRPGAYTGYNSPEYQALVQEMGITTDPQKLAVLYRKVNKLIDTEPWIVTVAPLVQQIAFNNRVAGVTENLDGMLDYESAAVRQ
jgi:ABC-type transport system substrate-binding protein